MKIIPVILLLVFSCAVCAQELKEKYAEADGFRQKYEAGYFGGNITPRWIGNTHFCWPVIFSLFIRIYTVAENFSPEHPFRQETQIQIHRTCFPIGQSSDDPVFPHPPGCDDIFSHFPLQYPGFIGHNG